MWPLIRTLVSEWAVITKMRTCFSRQLWKNKSNGRTTKKIKHQPVALKEKTVYRNLKVEELNALYGDLVLEQALDVS